MANDGLIHSGLQTKVPVSASRGKAGRGGYMVHSKGSPLDKGKRNTAALGMGVGGWEG
jgi:hypothetical protein